MNLNDAKEVKRNVDAVIAKRKPVKPETTKKQKTTKPKKPLTKKQKEAKSKFKKFIMRLILIEYILCAGILLVSSQIYLMKENERKDELINIQQQTIWKMANSNKTVSKTKVEEEQITYTTLTTNTVKNESRVLLGNFKITHYCACKKCCGPNAQGITASGKKVQEGITIAVDPRVISLGTKVYIEGYGEMEAQDTGSAIKGNIIDVYVTDHQKALELGVVYKDVYLVK